MNMNEVSLKRQELIRQELERAKNEYTFRMLRIADEVRWFFDELQLLKETAECEPGLTDYDCKIAEIAENFFKITEFEYDDAYDNMQALLLAVDKKREADADKENEGIPRGPYEL